MPRRCFRRVGLGHGDPGIGSARRPEVAHMKPTERASDASRRARPATVTLMAVAVVLFVLAAGLAARPADQSTLRGVGASWRLSTAGASRGFGISGSAGGLYPGASRRLRLVVTNRHKFAIVVTSISTTVASHAPGCRASNLKVSKFSGRLTVRARRSASKFVRITLSRAAPDPCQGVVFRLRYSGLARKR